MEFSIILIMLMMVPLVWAFVVLWNERKRFHSLTPFVVGAVFIIIARLLDVPMEIPSLQLKSLFGLGREYVDAFVVLAGDSADIFGVTFLVLGFSQTIKLLTTNEKTIQKLELLLPLCAWCKRIRSKEGTWESIETYLESTGVPVITHGVCPECAAKMVADYRQRKT